MERRRLEFMVTRGRDLVIRDAPHGTSWFSFDGEQGAQLHLIMRPPNGLAWPGLEIDSVTWCKEDRT